MEAFLLAGGASRRMGSEKAKLLIGGEPLAERIVRELGKACCKVTVLGGGPVSGAHAFLPDERAYSGPLVALSRAEAALAFVASCDLPFFQAGLVPFLHGLLGSRVAVIPELAGRLQPLCALYTGEALQLCRDLVSAGERRVMGWVEALDPVVVPLDGTEWERAVVNVNTPEEWERVVRARARAGVLKC